MIKNRYICLLIIFLTVSNVYGTGGLAGEFLNYGAGARNLGMGNCGTGLSDDASGPYFNPAGISQLNPQEFIIMHSMLIQGSSYNYLSYVHPTEEYGSFALSMVQARSGGVDDRNVNNVLIGEYGESETAGILSYAKNLFGFVSLGGNYKIISHSISHWHSLAQGIDLSLLLFPNSNFSLGFMAKNTLRPSYTLKSESQTYPFIMRSGLSYRAMDGNLIFASDASWSTVKGLLFSGGVEYNFHRYGTVRLGANHNYISYGLGFNIPLPRYKFQVDYTYLYHHSSGGLLSPSHNFSLTFDFGGFHARVHPDKESFSPSSQGKKNILWLEKEINTRAKIRRWQLIIKNSWGEVVRTYEAWGEIPARLFWDGRDETGNLVSDGEYFYELVVNDELNRTYSSEGKLTEIKTEGPEGRFIFEERMDTLRLDTMRVKKLKEDTLKVEKSRNE